MTCKGVSGCCGAHLILVTDKFENVVEIAVCKLLRGWPETFFNFVHCMCLYIFLHLFVQRVVPYTLLGIIRHRNVHYYYYYYYLIPVTRRELIKRRDVLLWQIAEN